MTSVADVDALADRVAANPDPRDAFSAVCEVLQLGGVGIVGGATAQDATDPAATFALTTPEAATIAAATRDRLSAGEFTAASLGTLFGSLGVDLGIEASPVVGAGAETVADGPPPERSITEFLAKWLGLAMFDDDGNQFDDPVGADPAAFAILFVTAMLKRQSPAVALDNADEVYSTLTAERDLRLTSLELMLLTAAYDRATAHIYESPAEQTLSSDPCTDVLNSWGQDISQLAGAGANEARSRIIKALLGSNVGDTLQRMAIVTRVVRVAALYKTLQLHVSVDPKQLHKQSPDEERLKPTWRLSASVNAWDDPAEVEAINDCFRSVGLPSLPDLSQAAAELEQYRVYWHTSFGFPRHADINLVDNTFDIPGQLGSHLHRVADTGEAEAKLVARVKPERGTGHQGDEYIWLLAVEAEVVQALPPSVNTIRNVIKGGIAMAGGKTTGNPNLESAVVELLVGWAQEIFPHRVRNDIQIEYHAPYYQVKMKLEQHRDFRGDVGDPWGNCHEEINGRVSIDFDAGIPKKPPEPAVGTYTGEANYFDYNGDGATDAGGTEVCQGLWTGESDAVVSAATNRRPGERVDVLLDGEAYRVEISVDGSVSGDINATHDPGCWFLQGRFQQPVESISGLAALGTSGGPVEVPPEANSMQYEVTDGGTMENGGNWSNTQSGTVAPSP